MGNLGYRIMQFMNGRNGTDALSLALMLGGAIVQLVARLFGLFMVHKLGLVLIILATYRMFSKNIARRQGENRWFLAKLNGFSNWRYYRKQRSQRDYTYTQKEKNKNGSGGMVYAYYYCPSCKQQIRVPAGKGTIKVTCPKCKETFEMNS